MSFLTPYDLLRCKWEEVAILYTVSFTEHLLEKGCKIILYA